MNRISDEKRRHIMRSIPGKDTGPELRVRRLAHALGYRFRVNCRDLPGSPDLVFPRYRAAVFVHGCFWHQHEGCRHANVPRTRPEYWLPKLARTQERDALALAALRAQGWHVLIIWECETGDTELVGERLHAVLAGQITRGAT